MARAYGIDGTRTIPLGSGWHVASLPAGTVTDPSGLRRENPHWVPAQVPGTAASALRAAGRWSLDSDLDFDATDWWWRVRFTGSGEPAAARVLRFGGLATIADVWLDDVLVLHSENMFVENEVDVETSLGRECELIICCRALGPALQARRPRPRWRTRLAKSHQLRWFRTSVLGRGPAWSPRAAPVGPWLPVVLEEHTRLRVLRADVRARLEGEDGIVDADVEIEMLDGAMPERAELHVGPRSERMRIEGAGHARRIRIFGPVRVREAERWWPHTHGRPARHPVHLEVGGPGRVSRIDFGPVGFRSITLHPSNDDFGIRVNEVDVFCRGACWTPIDAAALIGTPAAYRETLEAVRAAGMNMVRVSGPFFYEADAFYESCDELGILVWNDFAFASMDYPTEPAFLETVEREARSFLGRTQLSCSLAVLCGNSEVEQQAAMIGAPRESWRSPLFAATLAGVARERRPDVVYWPSTPSGGALPFMNDVGTAHYFGVGAYLRPLDDARRADVRFATECLAFANVPDAAVVDALMDDGAPPQDPRWKARVPRDGGAGWDFDDVRDYYFRELFKMDPLPLRYADVGRYLALSRVVTGEVMAATFSEWRRAGTQCRGALVWFLRDLAPGAGWGLLDSSGGAKAAYSYLRRVLQPVAILLTDEGLNGLFVHLVNEGPEALDAEVRLTLYRGEARIANATAPLELAARSSTRQPAAALFDSFHDATYAYRFGAPEHDVAVAALVARSSGARLGEAFHFPQGLPTHQEADLGLEGTIARAPDAALWRLTLRTRAFAQSVALDVPDYVPDDNYFHIAPGATREVVLRPTTSAARKPAGEARALNSRAKTKFVVSEETAPRP